ncbi:cell division protein FtsZ [uncultured Fibrobacter sp.]|uniref:cell division protein FtsZ n=1 Tax=uncultured Fibrobacter sp. TaxID=261512 RepID=UPI00262011A4|nr:cell division protein FtsZ [uncultured Fibrobacter sp.]
MSEIDNINFEVKSRIMGEEPSFNNAKVKVFGVGGAGGNTVNRMKRMNIEGVEYYAINTDAMALDLSLADHKILIGEKTTRNLGAGMDPEIGRKAAEENIEEIKESMKGADMVFVTAGMGGGTGTGAAPVVASVARELGILTVAVVTKPFRFEGNARSSIAQRGISALRESVDTIIVVENKKLLTLLQASNQKATMDEAFKMADEILGNAVQSICGIMFRHGLVHVDFADIRKVMLKGGSALMGTGYAQGENRGIMAADMALASPLLEDINIEGASGVLVNVAHGENYSLLEHSDAMEHIYEKVGEEGNPNIIIGDITDPALGDKVCITIIATGCGGTANPQVKAPAFNAGFIQAQTQSFAAQPVQAPSAQSSVQQATPRPTGFNVFDFNKIKDDSEVELFRRPAPAAKAPVQQPAAESASIPSLTETQVVRSVSAAMFASPEFNTKAPVEEEEVSYGSETSEFSAVADEDRLNGGRGCLETPAYTRNNQSVTVEAPVMSRPAVATARQEEANSLKDVSVDYNLPAYIRMNANGDGF